MSDNTNEKDMSFDNLLEELEGIKISEDPKEETEKNDIMDDIESEIDKAVASDRGIKTVTEDGMTFVDVTEQYVNKTESTTTVETTAPSKKQVRTFNQIFADWFSRFIPKKDDKTREKIRKIVMDVSLLTIIGCVIAFGSLTVEHFVQISRDKQIKDLLVDTNGMTEEQYDAAWQELIKKYPSVSFPEGMNLKYAYLYAINPELVGWIKIPGTNLDVQVVQTVDNDKYLKTDFYGKKSRYGCPYVDCKNDAKYLDDNTIIYGHHMSDGLMFSNLDKYKTIEGYKESPVIQYDTLYQTYYFKIIGAFITNSLPEDDNGHMFNYMITNFTSGDRFMSYISEVQKRSIFTTGVDVNPDDKLLTLSTCSYEFGKARLVVVARMCRENEDPNAVDLDKATINPSPRYPQAWYDAKHIANPYKDDYAWAE